MKTLIALFQYKIFRQLALSIAVAFFAVELVLLGLSYQSKKMELQKLSSEIQRELKNYNIHEDFAVLNQEAIEDRLSQFTRNVSAMVLLIVLVVTIMFALVFYAVLGRPLLPFIKASKMSTPDKMIRYPSHAPVPNNEMGDIIRARESLIDQLEIYQKDISEQLREAEAKVLHAAKLSTIGEMAGAVVHDLSNPIAALKGYCEILGQFSDNGKLDAKQIGEISNHMATTVDRMQKFIQNLNRFNRTEFVSQKITINEVVDNVLLMLQPKISGQDIEFINRLNPDSPIYFKGEMSRVEQAVMNILANAIDALESREIKQITIEAICLNENMQLYVHDTGEGMSEERIEKIFNSFYTTKKAGKGTGLGLSTTKKIIENMGGGIHVTSTVNKGTSFQINIPLNLSNDSEEAA